MIRLFVPLLIADVSDREHCHGQTKRDRPSQIQEERSPLSNEDPQQTIKLGILILVGLAVIN